MIGDLPASIFSTHKVKASKTLSRFISIATTARSAACLVRRTQSILMLTWKTDRLTPDQSQFNIDSEEKWTRTPASSFTSFFPHI